MGLFGKKKDDGQGGGEDAISGVTLEQYARIAKTAASRGADEEGLVAIAAEHGVAREDWLAAYAGWNERFKGNMPLAAKFGLLYQRA